MGGNQSGPEIVYNVPVGEKPANATQSYRCKGFEQGILDCPEDQTTMQDVLLRAAKKYPKNSMLGYKKDGKYSYYTYEEGFEIAKAIGNAILDKKLFTTVSHKPQDMNLIGIFAKNRLEWLLTEYGNFLYNYTMVPLYDTLGPESIDFVLKQTEMETIVASAEGVTSLLKCTEPGKLKNIIALDTLSEEVLKQIQEKGWNVFSWWELVEEYKNKEAAEFPKIQADSIFTFSYTSGTTGDPKGALISHKNMASICYLSETNKEYEFHESDRYLSYLPLPHIFERLMVSVVLHQGGCIGMYGGNVLKLTEDLAEFKPTVFVSVPRLFNKFYDKIKNGINSAKGVKGYLARKGLETKLKDNEHENTCKNAFWDKLVFNKLKKILGGNVRLMGSGGAPISPEVMQFMRVTLCAPMLQGYGSTETTGATFNSSKHDPMLNHVGFVQWNSEFKLEDIPDMNYMSTDVDEKGAPAPRGEICIRGHSIFKGYYKNEEKTKEAIDEDGWLHTGDVGLVLPNGALKIIDRKKNLFKLAQGEYIAPEKIENCYQTNKWADEVWIYGDTLQSTLVTFVVPNKPRVEEWAKEKNISSENYAELLENKDLKKMILAELVKTGKESGLHGFEQAKNIKLVETPFLELGITTNTFKIKRKDAREHFIKDIESMYANAL